MVQGRCSGLPVSRSCSPWRTTATVRCPGAPAGSSSSTGSSGAFSHASPAFGEGFRALACTSRSLKRNNQLASVLLPCQPRNTSSRRSPPQPEGAEGLSRHRVLEELANPLTTGQTQAAASSQEDTAHRRISFPFLEVLCPTELSSPSFLTSEFQSLSEPAATPPSPAQSQNPPPRQMSFTVRQGSAWSPPGRGWTTPGHLQVVKERAAMPGRQEVLLEDPIAPSCEH